MKQRETKQTISELVNIGRNYLKKYNIKNGKHESRLILSKGTGQNESQMIINNSIRVSENNKNKFLKDIYRRIAGKPVSRILGFREFYSRSFYINKYTLDPRPDSEKMVEIVIHLILKFKKKKIKILDLGTGSGCLIISIILEAQKIGNYNLSCLGVDISKDALIIAEKNKVKHNLSHEVNFIQSDWFSNINQKFDIIISNPPYIKTKNITNLSDSVKFYDPYIALNGGSEGYDCFERISLELSQFLIKDGFFVVEIDSEQVDDVCSLFSTKNIFKTRVFKDLSGRNRCVVFHNGKNNLKN
ncbi:peptide chain release factor N(5)-glutamine methyltransferase [Rickettsiales bacterium]|nr:peptide chain release factor N(5)-glutamine methyltransferase [Rickettsiales bacterium]